MQKSALKSFLAAPVVLLALLGSARAEPIAPAAEPLLRERVVQQAGKLLAQGQASYYGPGLHGRRTASGERFDRGALTAAHPSLPFGTRVRVHNLATGHSVDVRINDRGPFTRHRIIDLSEAAARRIGLHRKGRGVAPVQITLL